MNQLSNVMRLHAEMVAQTLQNYVTVIGTIKNYNSQYYMAQVLLQPEGILTGYLPVLSPWVGNGWGLFAPPSAGDQVEVQFQEGNISCGVICLRAFSSQAAPLAVNSGEFWLVHQTGSFIKLTNDGNISINANKNLNITINDSNGGAMNLTGNLNVTGNIVASGNITDEHSSMESIRQIYNIHQHAGSPVPDQQMST